MPAQSNMTETLMVDGQLPLMLNTNREKKLKTDKDETESKTRSRSLTSGRKDL